ncbi:centromere-associated protein E isoform X4 [Chelmon rostratus]|uniref:centromere-associated protein E isoform X4 n=1 Tax=Chelmon rostratus TaxID=109905 RepID=UPI001BE8882A|nr:centromere-associated protein E isoform X4 [Chelmon rostratus]
MTEESAVKVCVRVRPLIAREENAALENTDPVQLFWKADKKSIHQIDDGNSTKSFSFDRVFTAEETTNQLYQDIAKPLVVSSVEGYNGTIFAYGQTSSGKTFTMMGSDRIPGVIPLAVEDVFQTIKNCPKKEFLLRVSYMEIYNETVTDLLVDSWKRKPLEVRETINKNIYVADLTEELVTSPAQALAWIRKGEKNRHYGKTKMNQRSSRSHTIFRMILESRERSDPASGENADGAIIVSHLNLVDLAGSERASQTGAEGTRFKEGCNINRSLFTLGQVIKKLTDESQKGFTNYRDSKLTRILQNSLGGNAKTVIICTITPVTLDETLSTLQFASTAKKMKNDPHVTEVSDDGALLKRYRNEIVDLKRRLHEVSSVTQTTATEKEVLSQLLQEKDQLQREQEDRIKNLTKLLVTSSNLVPVKKMPKRRVTWGGKMLRFARPSACVGASSDLSFAESFTLKRKADRSCLMELGEDDEDFDSRWEIPDEPSDEMEMSQSSVTTRSFGDSPNDFVSPEGIRDLSGKVSNLELQLEMESQQKEEAMTKIETLDGRVAELELQLQTEAQQKHETVEKIHSMEQRAAELELQLQTEAQQKHETVEKIHSMEQRAVELELQLQTETQQKHEAMEKVEMLEFRMADLERRLEEQCDTQSETQQMRREFAETIELCEHLASEKDVVLGERDNLKQEQGLLKEQIESLEKNNAALSQELEEKREMDEFKSLEEEFKKEHEIELQNEISCLKKTIESSKVQFLELQKKIETLSEELKKKSDFAEELQSMSGKDLVQEVATLRRSLDDAEGISRDTKKEWAVLRSQNIALEETVVTLTAGHEKMDTEVNSLRFQLEAEKSRCRMMQCDLQKELKVVFDENTKLTTLLDGKVPKNLIDSVELERAVANLNKELIASREAEAALRVQLEDLASYQALPDKVDNLMKEAAETQVVLHSLQDELQEQRQKNSDLVKLCEQKDSDMLSLSQELQCVRDEKDNLLMAGVQSSAEEKEELLSTVASLTAERDQLKMDLQENVEMMIDNQEELRTVLEKNREQKERLKQLETAQTSKLDGPPSEMSAQQEELQTHLKTLAEELESVRAERNSLLSERMTSMQTHSEEVEKLLCRVTTLSEERDQLQEILEGLRQEKQQLRAELEDRMEMVAQAHSEFNQPEMLPSELQVRDEAVTQLQQEIEQLQATLQVVSEQKSQLEDDLQRNVEMATVSQSLLHSLQQQLQEQNQRYTDLERQSQETQAQLQQQVSETQCLQHSLQEELQEQKQMSSDHMKLCEQRESDLEQQAKTLSEQLESARAERDDLLFKKETVCQNSTEEVEKLLCRVTTLSEERDQLQEILEGLRQEKQQLRAELEDRMEMVAQAHSEFNQPEMLPSELQVRDEAVTQLQQEIEQLQATLQVVSEQKSQLEDDLQRNVEMATVSQSLLHSLQQQLQEQNQRYTDLERQSQETQAQLQQQVSETQCLQHSLQEELQEQKQMSSDHMKLCEQRESDLEQQAKTLSEQLESARAERDDLLFKKETVCQNSAEEVEKLLCRVTTLSEERDQLQEILEGLRQEKQQLRAELEDRMETLQTEIAQLSTCLQNVTEQKRQLEDDVQYNMNMVSTTQELLTSVQEELCEQKQMNTDLEKLSQEKECSLDQQMRTVTEKLESIEAERDSLLSEKEASCQRSAEEMEKLLCRVTTLSEERDQLQEILEGLRQEKQQLRAELEDRMEMMQQLEQQLQMSREKQSCVAAQRDASQQLLSEANTTISALQEQLSSLDQSTSAVKETALSRLQDSTGQIQESFRRFQHFIDTCSKYNSSGLVSALKAQCFLKQSYLTSLPKPTMNAYTTVCQLGLQTFQSLGNFMEHLKVQAQLYRNLFEELVKKDLAVFEERRLQDVLLCRVEAPSYSVKDEDFHTLWEHRLTELLDKRHLYLQKMVSISEKLWANMASFPSELSVESREREKFKEQVQAMFTNQPISFSRLDRILSCELDRRSAVLHSRKMTLQGIIDEQNGLFKELKLLEAQADAQLSSERSKSFTLLKAMEGAPLKTELSLLKDNQRLSLQLQQTEEKVKALFAQNEQLEDTQVRASDVVSNHKQATQLLQTELQDSRAQVEERENTIQTLRSKLQEFEKKSTSGAELEKLQNKLFKVEVELSSASDKHQQEIQRMTTLLNEKEGSLRKLKETLRKSQQQGEESFLQGEDLHARLTNPRGLVIKSSIVLEKTKLEEETKQLQLKIAELDSLVSSQQAEISKWKSRAIKLKGRSTAEVEKPSSPCTVTKRGLPMNSDSSNLFSSPKKLLVTPKKVLDSPRKVLESPKFSLLDSPKSRFFDVAGSSELMSRTCPKQFFDNSGLGTIPDAAVGADRKEEWWPKSPKQEDMCKTQ